MKDFGKHVIYGALLALLAGSVFAAKPVKQAPSTAEIYSVAVDRVSENIVVEGSGLDGAVFSLAGTLVPASGDDTQQLINFGAEVASVAIGAGNYNLLIDGANGFSLYIDGPIVDSGLGFCPCELVWSTVLDSRSWTDDGICIESGSEIAGNMTGTDADAGTTLTIGAVFDSGNSSGSVCSLTETGPFSSTLTSEPVNATQQTDCADYIKTILNCSTL